jgi:hypothetical protein
MGSYASRVQIWAFSSLPGNDEKGVLWCSEPIGLIPEYLSQVCAEFTGTLEMGFFSKKKKKKK